MMSENLALYCAGDANDDEVNGNVDLPYGQKYPIPKTIEAFRNHPCSLPHYDPNFEHPTPYEVKALVELMGWSNNTVARMTGVKYNKKGSDIVRGWKTYRENISYPIPYACWHLLLIYSGVIVVDHRQIQDYTSFANMLA